MPDTIRFTRSLNSNELCEGIEINGYQHGLIHFSRVSILPVAPLPLLLGSRA